MHTRVHNVVPPGTTHMSLVFVLQSKSKGQELFDQIIYHLDLVEADYFGLQFMDTEQVSVSENMFAYA